MRTKPPYADAAIADAAFACICITHIVGARRMSSDRSFARVAFLRSDPTTAFVVPYLVRQALNARSFYSRERSFRFQKSCALIQFLKCSSASVTFRFVGSEIQ